MRDSYISFKFYMGLESTHADFMSWNLGRTGQPTGTSAVSVPDFFRNGDYLLGPYWASVSTFLLRTSPPMTLSSACATAATQTNPVKIVEMGLRNEKTIMPPEVKVRAH